MADRARGLIITIAFAFVLIVNVIDGVADGFSIWNWLTIACAAFFVPYGIALTSGRRTTRGRD